MDRAARPSAAPPPRREVPVCCRTCPTWSSAPCCATSARPRPWSGSRPTRPARSRCSARASAPSRSAGHHYALVRCARPAPRARGTSTRCASTASASGRWPTGVPGERLPHLPEGRRRCRSCSAPAGWRRPHEPPYSLRKDEDERGREIDALHTLAAAHARRAPRAAGRTCCCCSATRSTPTRCRPATRVVHRGAARHERAAGRAGARLRGVHAALPRELGRPDDPLAALHGVDGDDLRRPRRPRRLEHLPGVARGDARHGLVGRPHRRRAAVVLGLPAHRQPQPPRARRRRAARADQGRPTTAGRAPARVRAAADERRPSGTPLELLPRPRPHARRGDRLARRARARGGQPLDARRARSGSGSPSTPRGTSTTCCSPPRCRGCSAPGMHYARGVERGGGRRRLGRRRSRRWPSGCAARWTWSTGPRSRTPSRAWPSCSARWARASAAGRRRRS